MPWHPPAEAVPIVRVEIMYIIGSATGSPQDLYWLAHALYMTQQYHRAAHLLQAHQLDKVLQPF